MKQAEAAQVFRTGFNLFYPSKAARISLLGDIVGFVSDSAGSSARLHPDAGNSAHRAEISPLSGRRCLKSLPRLNQLSNSLQLQLAMEGLAREDIAATLVVSAIHTNAKGREEDQNCDDSRAESVPTCTLVEKFDAQDLDEVMRMLLSQCVSDLDKHLWGVEDHSTPAEGPNALSSRGASSNATGASESVPTCSRVRLLLVLQEHMMSCWSDYSDATGEKKSIRDLCLAHAVRLLDASREVYEKLLERGNARDSEVRHLLDHRQQNAVRKSFMVLIPILCASITSLPTGAIRRVSLVAELLPLVIPVTRAIERFNHLHAPVAKAVHDALLRTASINDGDPFPRWAMSLEAALGMLSSDLVCNLIEGRNIRFHGMPSGSASNFSPPRELERNEFGQPDGVSDAVPIEAEANAQDGLIELSFKFGPFLRHARESFEHQDDSLSTGDEFYDLPKVWCACATET